MTTKKEDAVWRMFNSLPEDLQKHLLSFVTSSNSLQEFISTIMVGPCPKCRSTKTMDGEGTPLLDICVGICLECFALWCLECGRIFDMGQTVCDHWKEDETATQSPTAKKE